MVSTRFRCGGGTALGVPHGRHGRPWPASQRVSDSMSAARALARATCVRARLFFKKYCRILNVL